MILPGAPGASDIRTTQKSHYILLEMKKVMKDPQQAYVMIKKTVERGLLIIGCL